MKLQTRIMTGYLASSLLLLVLGATFLLTIDSVNPVVDDLDREVANLGQAISLSSLSGRIVALRTELSGAASRFVVTQDLGYERRYDRATRELSEVFERVINTVDSVDEAALYANLRETSEKLETMEREMINLAVSNQVAKAETMVRSEDYVELNGAISDFIATLDSRKHADSKDIFSRLIDVTRATDNNREKLSTLATVTTVSVILILAASLLFGVLIARSVSRPLTRLKEGAIAIGRGNFQNRTGIDREDEIGQLSIAFDQMAERLERTTVSRDELSNEVAERTRELREGIIEHNQVVQSLQQQREELTRVLRTATMSELTATLAHELNQPLTAIRSNAEAGKRFMATNPPDFDEIGEIFDDIIDDDQRAAEVIRHMRASLGKHQPEALSLNINQVVGEVINLVHSDSVIKNVVVNLVPNEDLPPVLGDRVQLQQVLLNLILNGFDAMQDVPANERRLTIHTARHGEKAVCVSVSDTGVGFNSSSVERLFESFHTTKTEGLGMGLPISRSIIEDHGGKIWASENPDQGATFEFTVPLAP